MAKKVLSALSAYLGPPGGITSLPPASSPQRSMTLLPPALVQSSLGEKCAVYLDQVTDNLPLHLQSLRLRLDPILTYLSSTPLGPLAQKLPLADEDQPLALLAAVIVCLFTVAIMSWRNPLNFLRRSPSYAPASNPQVNDEHFSYITPGEADAPADDAEPDIIALRHRGTIYPLHFRAYSIDDGILTVGNLREEAARQTDAGFADRVRLLYKGKLLKDNQRTCKAEGLKQHSEVLCVVSEVGASDVSDDSGQNIPTAVPAVPAPTQSRPTSAEASSPPTPTGKSKKGRKNKRNKKTPAPEPVPASDLSSNPAPVPNLKQLRTPLEQVNALTGWLQQEMLPRCDLYMADPPSEPKKREFEYKKLSETILQNVVLKADGIEPDEKEARDARRALIKEAQAALGRLDAFAKL